MIIRPFEIADTDAVVQLWRDCDLVVPWNDPYRDIERKLEVNPEMFLVGLDQGTVMASAMVGYEGHRGWVNYLAVDPRHRGKGYARQLMDEAENLLLSRNCPKLNLQIRSTNTQAIEFYRALGYELDHATGMGKRLIPDD